MALESSCSRPFVPGYESLPGSASCTIFAASSSDSLVRFHPMIRSTAMVTPATVELVGPSG